MPEHERRLAARLGGSWRDLLYVPGPGLAPALEPGLYRSSFIVLLADGPAVRITSALFTVFGDTLCRLRLEAVEPPRLETFGSFFDPARRGIVYTMAPDHREAGGRRDPDHPEWHYGGQSLRPRLSLVTGVRLLRERAVSMAGGEPIEWVADRGLVLKGAGGEESLLLASPDLSEHAQFIPSLAFYGVLLDPKAPARPGATARELLGYGAWDDSLEIALELETL
ncbi:MAG: hypothetical protein HY215_03460 [Candidatus Rokubacteria bacterium]|nr:hypothetical protein [Candidatus Rokubacteria bacterium]